MTLEEFEKNLAASKKEERRHSHRAGAREERQSKHRHHHRHRDSHDGEDDEYRHKRRRTSNDEQGKDSKRKDRHRHTQHDHDREEQDGARSPQPVTTTAPPTSGLKRDAWMEAPSALDIDYVQRRKQSPAPSKAISLGADFELKLHEKELNHHLRDIDKATVEGDAVDESLQHQATYTFGDAGSKWRMSRLKRVYQEAEELERKIEDVALERYGDLREFDDAREEEIELDRRGTYGADYVGQQKPSGELFQERQTASDMQRSREEPNGENGSLSPEPGSAIPTGTSPPTTPSLDQTTLNKMKAQLLKAQLRKDPQATKLEEEYNEAVTSVTKQRPAVVILGAMENRMLSSRPRNEIKPVSSRRGRERGQVEENEEMTISDMVREERRTRGQAGGESQRFADRIAKDAKYTNNLDYLDENASKLAQRTHQSDLNLRNTTIHDHQKLTRILDTCPLCRHEDRHHHLPSTPTAPLISLGTRTYLTIATAPELTPGGAYLVPIQHRTNLLECDDDEWEELRNFMKCLSRAYHGQGRGVLFYENAADPRRRRHAAMVAVPLPGDAAATAPAFFREAFLAAGAEWSQHRKIIDTLARSRGGGGGGAGLGKMAFRRSLVKEMPYFHVWFELDGGMGHVVEEPERWPRGDLFAREVLAAIVEADPELVRRQGRWGESGEEARVAAFKKMWTGFDWTGLLVQDDG